MSTPDFPEPMPANFRSLAYLRVTARPRNSRPRCGDWVINPAMVKEQVCGAPAHEMGPALLKNCFYDAVGNMLTSIFSDYTPITAVNMPKIKYGHIQTPSPHSYSGAKGMGEGGAAPIHTISAALQDALFPNGIIIEDSFNNADSLFRALVGKEICQAERLVKLERRES